MFEDMNRPVAGLAAYSKNVAKSATCSPDEAGTRSGRVRDLLVPERGHARVERFDRIPWGLARKAGGPAVAG